MSREILFKAKRLSDGEWVEGGYSYCVVDNAHFITIMGKDHISHIGFHQEIDPSTICQYTGLTDKNGNKIWENDICDRKERFPEIVKMHEGDWTLDYSYTVGKEGCYCNLGFYVCERNSVVVIGNIFDNPELLKKENPYITNGDKIRVMTDEELADFIEMKQLFALARNGTDGEDYTLDWLKEEVEE